MTRFLTLAAALLVGTVALSGCDSSRSNNALDDVEGRYRITELEFTAQGVDAANVVERLGDDGRLTIYDDPGDDALLETPITGRTNVAITVTRGQVTFTPVDERDREDFVRLLLPDPLRLEYPSGGSASELSTPIGGITTTANLRAYDPERYNAALTAVPGRLRVRFERVR